LFLIGSCNPTFSAELSSSSPISSKPLATVLRNAGLDGGWVWAVVNRRSGKAKNHFPLKTIAVNRAARDKRQCGHQTRKRAPNAMADETLQGGEIFWRDRHSFTEEWRSNEGGKGRECSWRASRSGYSRCPSITCDEYTCSENALDVGGRTYNR